MSWYDRRWTRRKKLTIQGSRVPGSVHEFPLYVSLANDPDILSYGRADGSDILFTAADGVTRLPHYRVVHQPILKEQAVWTIWSDPRAIRHVGRRDQTYVAYYTTNQGWWISSYNHDAKKWQHFQLRTHAASESGRWWDDHNNPAIAIRLDGRIVATYQEHSTGTSYVRISTSPEDISAFGPEIAVTGEQTAEPGDPAYNYANLYCLPDGTLWRHYRPLTTWSGLTRTSNVITSSDGGETWSQPKAIIANSGRTIYLVTSARGNRIELFFSDAHPDEWEKSSVYHAYYDHADGSYRRSDGGLIGYDADMPFGPEDATLIWDGTTPGGEAWAYHVEADEDGNVGIGFMVYSGDVSGEDDSYLRHDYYWGHFDGTSWKISKVWSERERYGPGQKRYSGGIVVDPEDLSTVYVGIIDPSVPANGMTRHIYRYTTPNRGDSWHREQVSTPGEGKAHGRPVVPQNRHPELPVFWLYGHYQNYLSYWTALATVGGHGDWLDSEHYVKVPEIRPDENTDIFVYYGNRHATDQSASKSEVFPPSLIASYRGTLNDDDLRAVITPGLTEITLDFSAVWESDRRGGGLANLFANDGAGGGFIVCRKNSSNHFEVSAGLAGAGTRTFTFSDLAFTARNWRSAFAPLHNHVLQVTMRAGEQVGAWMNGIKSSHEPPMPAGFAEAAPNTLRIGYSPTTYIDRQWYGWLDYFRIFSDIRPDSWLRLSAEAERNNVLLIERSTYEDVMDYLP